VERDGPPRGVQHRGHLGALHRPAGVLDLRLWRYTGTAWAVFTGGPTWAIYRATAQAITNNTWTVINFDSEDTDTGNMHSTSVNSFAVVINQPGLYAVSGKAGFVANATGQRAVRLTRNSVVINGSSVLFNNVGASNVASSPTPSCYVQCANGDVLAVQCWQQSGGNLNTSSGTVGTDSAGDFPLFTGTWLRD
jgi:archaellum component FlaG (FlaF/FlaG flagellin family)